MRICIIFKVYQFAREYDEIYDTYIYICKSHVFNVLFFYLQQDALVHSSNEKLGFRGFRKQLSGRFKRLVSRKSHEPSPVIPPELKPQLKTIYVY